MFKILVTLKDKLSHINAKTWHYQATLLIFGKKAEGKACTYYWFKLPLSLIVLLIVAIIAVFFLSIRGLIILLAWFFGYRFRGEFLDMDNGVTSSWSYTDYKERKNGSSYKIAPWELLIFPFAVWLVWLLAIVHPNIGITILIGLGVLTAVTILIYFFTASLKFPLVVQAR